MHSVSSMTDFYEGWKRRGGVILDVRSSREFRAGHIPGALNVPIDQVERHPEAVVRALHREGRLFIHCSSGDRAGRAAAALESAGREGIVIARGAGMSEWREHGYPVERGEAERASLEGLERSWGRVLGVGAAAGVIATIASGLGDALLKLLVTEEQRRRERRVRPGSPHDIAGPRLARRLTGHELTGGKRLLARIAFSGAYGVVWGMLHALLRRQVPRAREGAFAALGAGAFFLACDGMIAPALKLSPRLPKVPWQFNAKELTNHVTWVAASELLQRADERRAGAWR